MEAICFLEEDVIPVVILNDPRTCSLCCKTFLMDVARAVEREHPERFPENSFKIASTMERVVQNLLSFSITPCRQVNYQIKLVLISTQQLLASRFFHIVDQTSGRSMGNCLALFICLL